MLGFQPLASAPLAGRTEKGKVPLSGIVTNAPIVDAASILQNHVLSGQEISSQPPTLDDILVGITASLQVDDISAVPVVDNIDASFQQFFAPLSITLGSPVVESASLTFFFDFNADKITAGAPVVDGADYTEFTNFNANTISVTPIVDNADAIFEHIMGAGDITSGAPDIAVRFLWDFQEPFTDTWTEVSDIDNVWNDVSYTTKTWTEAA
tara:strand:+ start:2473 stop:3102 length:630 start_codon:yes stop_codon:yes gene_type:complete